MSATPVAKNHGARWSTEQDKWLWRHIGRMDAAACAEQMGRTHGSILSRLKLLAHRHMTEAGLDRAAAAEHIGCSEAQLQEWIDHRDTKPPRPVVQPVSVPVPIAIPVPPLGEEQEAIVRDVVDGNRNVFMTGVAGTGKTTTIRAVAAAMSRAGRNYGITAMTGTAAVLLGGQTLHSFLGIGLAKSTAASLAWVTRNRAPKRAVMLQSLELLIVDEVSMMDADMLDLVSEYLGLVRNCEEEPFGGLRVLFSGDMCQLPPVKGIYCFHAKTWKRANMVQHVLHHVYRQEDSEFLGLLERARWGRLNEDDIARLRAACNHVFPADTGIVPTRLYPLRRDVEQINQERFQALIQGKEDQIARYPAMFGKKGGSKEAARAARAWFESSRRDPVVELCPGAQVMATWNLKKDGVMNGTRGVVVRCSPSTVLIRLMCGKETEIGYQTITPMDNQEMEVHFMPLQLAWAISIHKSQGMTLDCMEADLGPSVFEHGQAYTALSRARNLEGVRLVSFHPSVFRTHRDVLAFYGKEE